MRTLCFILFSCLSLLTYSQKKYYVVKQTGDTLYGDIEFKNKVFIVNVPGNAPVILKAKEVKAVKIHKYSGTVVLSCVLHTYTDNLDELEKYNYQTSNIDTVLILSEVYQTPKMNLYWCNDSKKTQYYFYKTPTDSLPIQLYINYALGGGASSVFEQRETGERSKNHLEIQKGYVNQLRLIMDGCNKINEAVWELLDYRIYSFKDLIKRYNKCK